MYDVRHRDWGSVCVCVRRKRKTGTGGWRDTVFRALALALDLIALLLRRNRRADLFVQPG